jgi:predicted cupin superfamily sugar epimerase
MKVEEIVAGLGLSPHPEGGFYKETYRATDVLSRAALDSIPASGGGFAAGPGRFRGDRPASTAIFFLLRKGEFSALHRIASDEVWHFYAGAPLDIVCLHEDGRREDLRLGMDLPAGALPQRMVPAGTWFGSRLAAPGGFALVGCTVAPGFDFADFELGTREDLLRRFPHHAGIVGELTRG